MGVAAKIDNSKLLYDCPVARWLWESHCREEWCGVYDSGVYCYAPLTNEPSLVLCKVNMSLQFSCYNFIQTHPTFFSRHKAFVDIQSIRRLDTDDCSPLPGFSILAIDMASRCHYFSLPSDDARDELVEVLNSAMISSASQMGKCSWRRRFVRI